MRDFKTLKVWSKAHCFSLHVYQATQHFPKYERFGLTVQLRRSAVSIPSNIAEGCGRIGEKEFARFLGIALGSASEAEYQLLLSHDLKYLQTNYYQYLACQIDEIKRMLISLIRKIVISQSRKP